MVSEEVQDKFSAGEEGVPERCTYYLGGGRCEGKGRLLSIYRTLIHG